MLIESVTRRVRRYLVGDDQDFSFRAAGEVNLPPVDKMDLYIHIPFCKTLCPYCPYNRIKYDRSLVSLYLDALLSEIEQYRNRVGKIEVTSIYVGGGTPTTLIDELGVILDRVRERFSVTGDICVETNPGDITEKSTKKLVGYGVNLISLGVQSFDDRYLKLLGRNYRSDMLDRTVALTLSSGFRSVNLDLMFALPGQTVAEVKQDLDRAVRTGANQITAYPLLCFPYSTVGRFRRLRNVEMPNIVVRRRMYRTLHDHLAEKGFRRVSVWGFQKGEGPRYSSVTRDYYIGLGAGAGSHVPGSFYLNTFSVEEYVKRCRGGKLPVAVTMDFTDSMSRYYWLYWRLYDTYVSKKQLFELFGSNDRMLNRFLRLLRLLRMAKEGEDQIALTERGAFWVHLAQNYFVLNYINRVWSVARETPFPDRIRL